MQIATAEDFKPNALLQRICDGKLVRILSHVRDDAFNSIHQDVDAEIQVHSREAHCYHFISDDAIAYFSNADAQ